MNRVLWRIGIVFISLLSILYFIFLPNKQTNKLALSNPDTKKSITIVGKIREGDYWESVKMGAEAAGKEFNVNVTYLAPPIHEDVKQQIELIKQSYRQGMAALVYAPSDYKQPSKEISEISKHGIPVIAIDSEADSPDVRSFIGTDNYLAGFTSGEKILELTGGKANIAIISSVEGGKNELQKEKGLEDSIGRHPEARIAETEYCNSDQILAEKLTEKLLASKTRINGIVALDVTSSVGAANEIKKLKLDDKIKIVTFDSSQEELGLVQDGVIQETIIQNPYRMGYLSVKYAVDALNRVKVPKKVNIDTRTINLDNMFWPENEKLLFPFVS